MPRQSTRIVRQCQQCGKEFRPSNQHVKEGWGFFCSRPCYLASKVVVYECQHCGDSFTPQIKASRFCSRVCCGAYRRAHPQPSKLRLPPLRDRLASLVEVFPVAGCVLWAGPTANHGYGVIRGDNKRQVRVHRAVWEYFNGPIPDGVLVCHRCDVPACYNIDHLFLGTAADNTADMLSKQRECRGVSHPHARMDDDKVREVKVLRAAGWSRKRLALRYGVSEGVIQRIYEGKSWKHVS